MYGTTYFLRICMVIGAQPILNNSIPLHVLPLDGNLTHILSPNLWYEFCISDLVQSWFRPDSVLVLS